MIIKYLVEEAFKDKYTKKDIVANTVLEVDIKRMKELNEKKKGRVIDIILDNNIVETKEEKEPEIKEGQNEITNENTKGLEANGKQEKNSKEVYTTEQLEDMTVNDLKELADKIGCELKKAKKDEIIQEILAFQEK